MADRVKRKVILDTDVGLDDCECLIYLTACKDIELLAVTLVSGNADMPIISENAKKVLSFLGCENVPLYEAGCYNLLGEYVESDGYFGDNAFAGIELPKTNLQTQKDMSSALALIHYVRKYPHEVDLLFIGPLTNLALAFLLDNKFLELINSVYVMGTDSSEVTIRCITPYSEFNIYTDPAAYFTISRVLKNLKRPIVIIDYLACQKSLLNPNLFDRLYGSNKKINKHVELMSIIRDFSNPIISKSMWENGFLTCDLFAVCGWHDPSIILKKSRVKFSIELFGEKRGHTVFEHDEDGFFELVESIDTKKMEENIIKVLNGAHLQE